MHRLKSLMVLLSFFALVSFDAAQDGASIYKSKCAACHGANGEGKVGPALKGTSMSDDDIVTMLSKGDPSKKAPHKNAMSSLSADQVKAVAEYVKSLK